MKLSKGQAKAQAEGTAKGRAGQGRREQGTARQGRTGQGRQGRAGEGKAGQGRAGQGMLSSHLSLVFFGQAAQVVFAPTTCTHHLCLL